MSKAKKILKEEKKNNIVTVNGEEINIESLGDDSLSYLNHVFDLDKQLSTLEFKAQQARTAKTAFLSMFNNSRKEQQQKE